MAATNPATVESNDEAKVEKSQTRMGDPLQGVPEILQIHLGEALDWVENRTESHKGGVRLAVDQEEVEFREWTASDLASCFEVDEPEAGPYREAVVALSLLLKVRGDLKEIESGGSSADEDLQRVEECGELFDTVLARIQKAIDASVLRGSLVGARNLSRLRDLVGSFRLRMDAMEDLVESRRKEERRKSLGATGKEFSPASEPSIRRTAPKKRTARPKAKARTRKATRPGRAVSKRKNARAFAAQDTYRFPWMFFLILGMAVFHWGLGIHMETVTRPEPSLDSAAWERILPLRNTFTAGGVLYATIGEDWNDIPYRERLDRFQRLHERAELSGYQAVVLTDEGGDFAAQWSRGSIAQVWTN